MKKNILSFLLLLLLSIPNAFAQTDSLRSGFLNPPQEAKPRVWWHWMNGNISEDGIRKDLRWMDSVGIGGVQIFDASLETPEVVKPKVVYMTEPWKRCFKTAVSVADSLGMEVAMMATPGWSNTGGPWVKPQDAMKKLVWRTLDVGGGRTLRLQMPEPYTVSGTFQNVKASGTASSVSYYEDVALIAVRLPECGDNFVSSIKEVTSSTGKIDWKALTDDDVTTAVTLPRDTTGGNPWIQFSLSKPAEVSSLSISDGLLFSQFRWMRPRDMKWLEVSDDGEHFRKVLDIENGSCFLSTISFSPIRAQYFRVVWKGTRRPLRIGELRLSTQPRVNHAEEKAAFGTPTDIGHYPSPNFKGINPATDIIDLTGHMDSLGRLTWTAPDGQWRVYRFGCSLTGKMNHPAPKEATGLEVDKLDSLAVSRYLDDYFALYDDFLDEKARLGINSLLMDSYEAGICNWTHDMWREFKRRCGYDMRLWMPALAGVVIADGDKTDRFLYDFRSTIGALLADNLYGQVSERLRRQGMTTYFEAHETCRVMESDGMDIKRRASFPMGAMWASLPVMNYTLTQDLGKQGDSHETASTAHIYGQQIAAAESMTCNGLDGQGLAYSLWGGNLKPVVDLEFANGINRVVIHSSDHQPDDTHLPGFSLGVYGQWFHRHETWAKHARPWVEYISRSSFMLQQGLYVADVAYYYGHDANVTALFSGKMPDVPQGYSYDYVSPHAFLNEFTYSNGRLVTPSGMEYKVLALDANADRMTLKELEKIGRWIRSGLTVCGNKPKQSLSLNDDDAAFRALADDLWSGKYPNVSTEGIEDALAKASIAPDFECQRMDSVRFVHRHKDGCEVYWVNNRSFLPHTLHASFRVSGLKPQRWNPETGAISDIAYEYRDGRTWIDMEMQQGEACFIVFRGKADKKAALLPQKTERKTLISWWPAWKVMFQGDQVSPSVVVADCLMSYTESSLESIKYFSGTATYLNSFTLKAKDLRRGRILLSLGDVGCIAEVSVNGHYVGQLWHSPYDIDITDYVRKGVNRLDIEVVNMWRNRIIGDRQPDCKRSWTFTSYPFFNASSPLQPSGLMGPVKVYGVY